MRKGHRCGEVQKQTHPLWCVVAASGPQARREGEGHREGCAKNLVRSPGLCGCEWKNRVSKNSLLPPASRAGAAESGIRSSEFKWGEITGIPGLHLRPFGTSWYRRAMAGVGEERGDEAGGGAGYENTRKRESCQWENVFKVKREEK